MDNYNTNKLTRKLFLTFTAGVLATTGARAYELKLGTNMPPVDFHGFVSQGFLLSSAYDYLGESTRSGDPKFFEAGVNASFNPFPRTHITAQGFMFDVGNVGEYQPVLDYAQADYTLNDEIGVRAGRIITVTAEDAGKPRSRLKRGERTYVYKQSACRSCGGAVSVWDMAGRRAWACTACQR